MFWRLIPTFVEVTGVSILNRVNNKSYSGRDLFYTLSPSILCFHISCSYIKSNRIISTVKQLPADDILFFIAVLKL